LHEFTFTFSSLDNIVHATFHLFVPQIKPYSTWFEQCFYCGKFSSFCQEKGPTTSTKDFFGGKDP
jgi:hypothetical protein